MQNIIKETLSQFMKMKRGEDTIVVLKDDAPEVLRESVMQAHGDRMPSDWIHAIYYQILDEMSENNYDCKSTDDIEENRPEIIDGLVDIYTADLTAWLASHIDNVQYLTDAVQNCDHEEANGIEVLTMAQYDAISEIYSEVASYIEDATERMTASDKRAEQEAKSA